MALQRNSHLVQRAWAPALRMALFLTFFASLVLLSGRPAFSLQHVYKLPSPNSAINDVYMVDANNAYACGNGGVILKTTDGGSSWTTLTSGTSANLNGIWATPPYVWCVGNGGVILSSIDLGTTWTSAASGTTNDLLGVYGQKGLVGGKGYPYVCGKGGTILYYNGAVFEPRSSGTTNDLYDIFQFDPMGIIAVGAKGTLSFSGDGGSNFFSTNIGTTKNLYSVWATSPPSDTSKKYKWVVGEGGTIYSFTTAAGWQAETSPVTYDLNGVFGVAGSPTNTLYAVGKKSVSQSTILINTSGSWGTWSATPYAGTDLYKGDATSTSNVMIVGDLYIAGKYDGSIWKWNRSMAGDIKEAQVVYSSGQTKIVGCTSLGTFISSTDDGQTFSEVSVSTKILTGVYFKDLNTGWLVGDVGNIYKTTNGGTTWTALSSGTTDFLSRIRGSGDTLWVGSINGKLLKSANGGGTFTSVTVPGWEATIINDLWFDGNQTIWIVGDSGKAAKTTDGGTTWTSLSTGTSNNLLGAWVDRNNPSVAVIVGVSGTIRKTTDGGTAWTAKTSGLTTDVGSIFDAGGESHLFALANSGVVLESNDVGETWVSRSVASAPAAAGFSHGGGGVGTTKQLVFSGGHAGVLSMASSDLKFAFATSALNVEAGGDVGQVQVDVQSVDSGKSVRIAENKSVTISSSSNNSEFSLDASLASPTRKDFTFTISSGSFRSPAIYVRNSAEENPTFTVSATGLTSATQAEAFKSTLSQTAFTTAPSGITAGDGSQYTVQGRNKNGVAAKFGASDLLVTSSSSTSRFDVKSDGGFSSTNLRQNLSGIYSLTFYLKHTKAESVTLTAELADGSITKSTATSTVVAAPPKKLALVTSIQPTRAGEVSNVGSVQAQDQYSNPASVSAATTVQLQSSSSTGRFDTKSTGAFDGSITSINIATGANSASFYYKDTTPGTPTIILSAAGLDRAAQIASINVGPATKLVFTTAPKTVNAGEVSLITVRPYDKNDILATFPSSDLLISSSSSNLKMDTSSTGAFTSTTLQQNLVGKDSFTFYIRDTKSESPTFTAEIVGDSSIAKVSSTPTVLAAPPKKLALVTSIQPTRAGEVSNVGSVQAQDQYSNPASVSAATTVQLQSSSSTGRFDTKSTGAFDGSITSINIATGANSASFYYKDTTPGTPTIILSAAGLDRAAQIASINVGPPVKFSVKSELGTLLVNIPSKFTLTTQDSSGTDSGVTSATIFLIKTDSSSLGIGLDSKGPFDKTTLTIPAGLSSTDFYVRETTSGSKTFTVEGPSDWTSASVSYLVNPGRLGVFTSIRSTVQTKRTNQPIRVGLTDGSGAVVKPVQDVVVTISYTGRAYREVSGGTPITSFTLTSTNQTQDIYIESDTSGSPEISWSAPGGVESVKQAVTVNSENTSIAISTGSSSTGSSGSGTLQLNVGEITKVDVVSNKNLSGTTAVELTADKPGVLLALSPTGPQSASLTVSITPPATSASVYVQATASGSSSINLKAGGMDPTLIAVNAVVPAVSGPVGRRRIVVKQAPSEMQTGAYTPIVLQMLDTGPIETVQVKLESTSPDGRFYFSNVLGAPKMTSFVWEPGITEKSIYYTSDLRGNDRLTVSTASSLVTGTSHTISVTTAAASAQGPSILVMRATTGAPIFDGDLIDPGILYLRVRAYGNAVIDSLALNHNGFTIPGTVVTATTSQTQGQVVPASFAVLEKDFIIKGLSPGQQIISITAKNAFGEQATQVLRLISKETQTTEVQHFIAMSEQGAKDGRAFSRPGESISVEGDILTNGRRVPLQIVVFDLSGQYCHKGSIETESGHFRYSWDGSVPSGEIGAGVYAVQIWEGTKKIGETVHVRGF